MATPILLTRDYAYDDFRIANVKSTLIDASNAHWDLSNFGKSINLYPVFVDRSSDVTLVGGTITGHMPLDMDWRQAYVNSAAITFRGSAGHIAIKDWTISQAWDGIRIDGKSDFLIENVWIDRTRDDAVENDDGLNGTIRNSLFDKVFVGISIADDSTPPEATSHVVTLDNVLIHMESYLYKGNVTHGPIFKLQPDKSPDLAIKDSIFAIEDVDHFRKPNMEHAWANMKNGGGNYFLNLSDDPLSSKYPLPKSGFTILQGREARSYWESARAEWISENTDQDSALRPTHAGTSAAETLKGAAGNDVLLGGAGGDSLYGNDGNDVLRGQDSDDYLAGRRGVDILIGGLGADRFRFANAAESLAANPDIIRAGDGAAAFEGVGIQGGDQLDLRGFDADTTVTGIQKFVFGSTGRGGLSLVDLGNDNTLVRGNTNGDAAFEFAVVIEDGVIKAADYAAVDLML
jgi:hypothetical protein